MAKVICAAVCDVLVLAFIRINSIEKTRKHKYTTEKNYE